MHDFKTRLIILTPSKTRILLVKFKLAELIFKLRTKALAHNLKAKVDHVKLLHSFNSIKFSDDEDIWFCIRTKVTEVFEILV